MPVTTAGLRAWILIIAGVLVAAIAGFLFYGRWLSHRLGHEVLSELGKTIQQSTKGFTYSESRGGHTLYTLHASNAVQYKNGGHLNLHEVSITLYSAQGAPSNRIYGSDFDWDPAGGVARAVGEVQIDLQGGAGMAHGSKTDEGSQPGEGSAAEGESKSTVHVKTSGLEFNKKTAVASTKEKIEFRLAEAAGSAVGASFDSQTGVVILTSDVAFNSSLGGSALTVRARHAQYDRDSKMLYLLQTVTDFGDNHSSSDQATVRFRPDGSAYEVEEEGKVILTGRDGQQVNTRKAHIDLGPDSTPRQAIVNGGMLYTSDTPARLLHGSASSGTLLFGTQLTIRHAQLRDAVSLVDQEKLPPPTGAAKSKPNAPASTSRQVQASRIDIDFAPGQDQPEAEHILAAGGARINIHTIYSKATPQDTTVQADQLFATLLDGVVLSSLRGTGHTSLTELKSGGGKQTSTGDTLLLTFAPPRPASKSAGKSASDGATPQAAVTLQSALQSGNVTLTQEPGQDAAKPGPPNPGAATATADRASYDAVKQRVQLSGNPHIRSAGGEISANSLELDQTTGNATATGGVKATYHQTKGQQDVPFSSAGAVHVVADHAHLDHATDLTVFYGAAAPARLWEGSDSVSAPVLELSRMHATLNAHGEGGHGEVNAIFTSSSRGPVAKAGIQAPVSQPSIVRLQSRALAYDEAEHKAVFSGAVVAQTSAGLLRSNFIDIYFSPPSASQSPSKVGQPQSGRVSRLVARGAVEVVQSGRKGTGEELTYAADEGKVVLTGTTAAPPRLSDQVHGTVTGNALIFNDRDDSVIVSGGSSKALTQTRVAR